MVKLTDPIFTNEDAARAHFEALRWASGRACPHCGTVDNSTLMKGKTTRAGLYKCKDCRKPFTATMGTVYERSHIPLHKWLMATHLIVSSKKGISAHQLYRLLGFGSYKTAWFMAHRIREAMRPTSTPPLGEGGTMVEADETYIGNLKSAKPQRSGFQHKMKVLALIDRSSGAARSYVLPDVSAARIWPILAKNLSREAFLMTDEARVYRSLGDNFSGHGTVNHFSGEYVDAWKPHLHTNTVEGYFSIFKRGMRGIYQHCGEQHLHRYLAEFDFRYTNRIANGCNDTDRAEIAVMGTVGRRLTYQQSHKLAA